MISWGTVPAGYGRQPPVAGVPLCARRETIAKYQTVTPASEFWESHGHSAESHGHAGHLSPGAQAHVYQELTSSARSHRATGPRGHTVRLPASGRVVRPPIHWRTTADKQVVPHLSALGYLSGKTVASV